MTANHGRLVIAGSWFGRRFSHELDVATPAPTGGEVIVLSGNGAVNLVSVSDIGGAGTPGPQGDPGPQGPQGVPGADGIPGADGAQGLQGPAGSQGIQGLPGNDGAQGPQGIQGLPGSDGAAGAQGLQGIQGPAGADGPQGIQGIPGNTGPAGADGAQGIQGIQGVQGNPGANGQGVPIGGTAGQVLAKTSATDYATAWTTPSGGSDPWVYVKLAADFVTSSSTAVDAGLAFTPLANTQYEFKAVLLTRTATTTVGPRPGIAWPTGMTDGAVQIRQTSSATAFVSANGNINAAVLAPVGGLPSNSLSYPAFIDGTVIAGASPSGTVKVQLASETNGTNVTLKAGSFLKYRAI